MQDERGPWDKVIIFAMSHGPFQKTNGTMEMKDQGGQWDRIRMAVFVMPMGALVIQDGLVRTVSGSVSDTRWIGMNSVREC